MAILSSGSELEPAAAGAQQPGSQLPSLIGAALVCSGCSFLLDFESLKNRQDGGGDPLAEAPGMGPLQSAVDASRETVAGNGTGSCQEGCDDGDACTTDRCNEGQCEHAEMQCETADSCRPSVCVAGQCQTQTLHGKIVADGVDFAVSADSLHYTSSVTAGGRFFSATYGVFDGKPDIHVSTFGATDRNQATSKRLASGLPPELMIVSPAGITADDRSELELNLYVAVRDTASEPDALAPTDAEDAGTVIRIRLNESLEPVTNMVPYISDRPSYRSHGPSLGPRAGIAPGGEPYVVWPGETDENVSGIFIQQGPSALGGDAAADSFIPVESPLLGLQTLDSAGVPGAVWMTSTDGGGINLEVATQGQAPVRLNQCNVGAEYAGHSLEAARLRDDLWVITWSKRDASSYLAESTILVCQQGACQDAGAVGQGLGACTPEANASRVRSGLEHFVFAPLTHSFDDRSVLYQALATTEKQLGEVSDSVDLGLYVNPITEADSPTPSQPSNEAVESVVLTSAPAASAPRHPTIVALGSDRIAVTWLQPEADGAGEELRVQRHRICF